MTAKLSDFRKYERLHKELYTLLKWVEPNKYSHGSVTIYSHNQYGGREYESIEITVEKAQVLFNERILEIKGQINELDIEIDI